VHLSLGPHRFDVTHRAVVMGILNRTPDSFYDKGTYYAFDAFLRCFWEEDVLIRTTGDIIALSPPLIIEKPQIERLIGAKTGVTADDRDRLHLVRTLLGQRSTPTSVLTVGRG
jgi:adenosylmethionine-8-amino-7-oxononanoate aminotransferase